MTGFKNANRIFPAQIPDPTLDFNVGYEFGQNLPTASKWITLKNSGRYWGSHFIITSIGVNPWVGAVFAWPLTGTSSTLP